MPAEVESESNELPDLTAEMKVPEDFVKSMLPPDQEIQLEPKSAVSMRPKCERKLLTTYSGSSLSLCHRRHQCRPRL